MTESKPTSNTLPELLKEGLMDYESDTVASSVYGNPPTPPAHDTMRIAPNSFVERDEVPLPLVQRAAVDPALGVLHNALDEEQAQYLQSVDKRKRQAQCVATAYAHGGYCTTQPSVVNAFVRLPAWVTGPKAATAASLAERKDLRARNL
uniref:Uncharacterized protein n=1 Tax=Peronospora matthiolae TaxID=2874970 RepID=A0AAV1TE43_9STRA